MEKGGWEVQGKNDHSDNRVTLRHHIFYFVIIGAGLFFPRLSHAISFSEFAEFTGEAETNFAATGLQSAGDVDGDGYDDFLVGAHGNADSAAEAGAAYLIYGQSSLFSGTQSLSGYAQFTGEAASDYAGISVSGSGDVNNDGYDDFLIGAYENDDAGSNAGAVYLIYGSATRYTGTLSLANYAEFTGEAAGDAAGRKVGGMGDVNNDGYDDFLISAEQNDDSGAQAGAAYLIYGQSSFFSGTMSLSNYAEFTGEVTGDRAGECAFVGDVNNDGYDDFLIGARSNDDAGSSAGAAYLIYGQSSAFSGTLSLSNYAEFTGEAASDAAGVGVAHAGDVNKDGYSDFLIGADGNDDAGSAAGAIYLIYGQSTAYSGTISLSNYTEFTAEAAGDDAGDGVSFGGDINNDGFDDLLFDASLNDDSGTNAGAAYVGYLYVDADRDGTAGTAGILDGTDCSDSDATVSTNQTYYIDSDGDGVGVTTSTTSVCSSTAPSGYSSSSTDCNDADGTVSANQTYYQDLDGDGLGSDVSTTLCSATAPSGYVSNSNDADDVVPNAGVEIGNDLVDNDGDGLIDEVNTVAENGLHPTYGSTLVTDADTFESNVLSISGAKRGRILVTYADYSVYRYRIFRNYEGDAFTKVKSFQGTGELVVLHPKAKKIALVSAYKNKVFDRVSLSEQPFTLSALKLLDVRHDGSTEVVVVAKKKAAVKVTVLKVKVATKVLRKKDAIHVTHKKVVPRKTTAVKKQIRLRSLSGDVLVRLRVSKKYQLSLV